MNAITKHAMQVSTVRKLEVPLPPITAKVERITPEVAQQILSNNPRNRVLKDAPRGKYTEDMRSGYFNSLNGEPIIINRLGGLEDGQHRLLSLIDAGVPFLDFVVVRGVEPRANETIDQGSPRTVADTAKMHGFECTRLLTAAVRWCWTYEHAWPAGLSHTKELSNQKLMDYLHANSHIAYASAEVRKEYPRACKLLMPSVAVFVRVATDAIDPKLSNDLFHAINTGEFTHESRQVLKLRDKLLAREGRAHRLRPAEVIVLSARVWNAMRNGTEIKMLVVAREMGEPGQPYRNAPRFE